MLIDEIIEIYRKEFSYIDREEETVKNILNNENNIFIEKRDNDNLIAISVINENTLLFFYVKEEYRNKGIGSSLLEESIDIIKKNKYKEVIVGCGFDYLMPGVPTSKRYYTSVNENIHPLVNDIASTFFEHRGFYHSWDCNCFDMKMSLNDLKEMDYKIGDTINGTQYRWAEINDLEEIISATDDACQYQDEKFSKYYKNPKLYKDDSNQKVLIAIKDNKVVGVLMVSIETEGKDLGNVGCTSVRDAYTHQGIATNLVYLGTKYLKEIGLKNASLSYTYSGLDKLYGTTGYKISTYYMMAKKDL